MTDSANSTSSGDGDLIARVRAEVETLYAEARDLDEKVKVKVRAASTLWLAADTLDSDADDERKAATRILLEKYFKS